MVIGKKQIWQFSLLIIIATLLIWAKITRHTNFYDNLLIFWWVGICVTIWDLFKVNRKS